MLANNFISEQDPPGVSAIVFAAVFIIGFLALTLIAFLQARGDYFARHTIKALLSLGITLIAFFWYFLFGFALLWPDYHHRYHTWIPDRNDLTYPIDVALGITWYAASCAWYRIVFRWFTQKRQMQE